jgi:hypothetical protein
MSSCLLDCNLVLHAGWEAPSSSAKPQPPIPEALKPLLHECYAMYSLLLPYALPVQLAASTIQQVERPRQVERATKEQSQPGGSMLGSSESSSLEERNANVLVGIREGAHGHFRLAWKPAASISVLSAGNLLGDSVQQDVLIRNGKAVRLKVRSLDWSRRCSVPAHLFKVVASVV